MSKKTPAYIAYKNKVCKSIEIIDSIQPQKNLETPYNISCNEACKNQKIVINKLRTKIFSCWQDAYATVTSGQRYTSWIAFKTAIPSFMGLWNALRPEINPIPPARLLITAVVTASAISDAPDDAPPELIKPARPI